MNGLQIEGIIFMIIAWTIVGSLTFYCLFKVLTIKKNAEEE